MADPPEPTQPLPLSGHPPTLSPPSAFRAIWSSGLEPLAELPDTKGDLAKCGRLEFSGITFIPFVTLRPTFIPFPSTHSAFHSMRCTVNRRQLL